MSGYAASARIVRASPRVVRHGPSSPLLDWRPIEAAAVVVDAGHVVAPREPISIAERCDRFRDRWHQLTFYVTDPESWR